MHTLDPVPKQKGIMGVCKEREATMAGYVFKGIVRFLFIVGEGEGNLAASDERCKFS